MHALDELSLRPANESDLELAMSFIQQAKAYHRELGLNQWTDAYPALEDIQRDIAEKKAYFLCDKEEKVGYICLDFDGEAAYQHIEGRWLTPPDTKYMAMHRLALDGKQRGKGYSSTVFLLAEAICREKGVKSIRADTHPENQIMQHVFPKVGFTYCGIVRYEGSPRTAFEKIL